MADVATAFVRIRPNLRGFKEEAQAGTEKAGAALGKVFALAFGTVVAAELAKHSIEAAANQQASIARVTQIAKAAGASLQNDGKDIRENLVELAEKTGFSVDQLAQAFGRVEQQTKDTGKSFQTLGTIADVARARNQGLAQVATALTRAYAGNVQGLSRLGIILPKYTANVDALKAAHDSAAASGVKFTAEQNLEYKAQLAAAKATDKATGAQQGLAEVSKRFRGQGAIFGETAAGQVARFHVAVEELEVTVGNKLLPYLSAAAEAGRKWADELGHSASFADFADNAINTLADGARSLGDAFREIAPEIEAAVSALRAIIGSVGVGPILAAYGAYKVLGVGLRLVNVALKEQAASAAAAATATAADTAATETLGPAAATTAADVGLLDAALVALAPQLAILAGAAIIGGLFYLSTQIDEQTQKVHDLANAYGALKDAQTSAVEAGRGVATARLDKSSAVVARQAAADQLHKVREQEARDLQDAHASAAVRAQDALNVAQAEDQWRQANARVLETERGILTAQNKAKTATEDRAAAVKKLTDEQVAQLAFQGRAGIGARGANLAKNIEAEVAAWRHLATQTDKTTAAQRFNLRTLADITEQTQKLPSFKQITIALNDKQFFNEMQKVRGVIGAAGDLFQKIVSPQPEQSRGGKGLIPPVPPAAAAHITGQIADATSKGVSQGLTRADMERQIAQAFKDAVVTAKQSLVSIGDDLGSQIGQVMDAALQASEAKLDSSPAAQRVKDLTAEVAAIQARRDARDQQATIDTTAADLAKLQKAFGPGAHTAEQDAQLTAARNAALDAVDAQKEAEAQGEADSAQKSLDARKQALEKRNELEKTYAARRIADLDSELNRHLISEKTYVAQVNVVLRREGANFKSAGRFLGTSFAEGFKEQLAALLQQGKIIAGLTPGELGPGSGNAPVVTNPKQVKAKTAADLQQQRDQQAATKTADNTAETVAELKKLGAIYTKTGQKFTIVIPPSVSDKDVAHIKKIAKALTT